MNSAEVNIMAMNLERDRLVRLHIAQSRALRALGETFLWDTPLPRAALARAWRVAADAFQGARARLQVGQSTSRVMAEDAR